MTGIIRESTAGRQTTREYGFQATGASAPDHNLIKKLALPGGSLLLSLFGSVIRLSVIFRPSSIGFATVRTQQRRVANTKHPFAAKTFVRAWACPLPLCNLPNIPRAEIRAKGGDDVNRPSPVVQVAAASVCGRSRPARPIISPQLCSRRRRCCGTRNKSSL